MVLHHPGLRVRAACCGRASRKAGTRAGYTKVGADLTPLGTTDFSSYPHQGARAANPDVIVIFLTQGGDDDSAPMKQAVQFGLGRPVSSRQVGRAGARGRLGRPASPRRESEPGSSSGTANQPDVTHNGFRQTIRKTGRVPTARVVPVYRPRPPGQCWPPARPVARRRANGQGAFGPEAATREVSQRAARRGVPAARGRASSSPACSSARRRLREQRAGRSVQR